MTAKKHIGWVDSYKGLLIVLIVLGHVLGGAPVRSGLMASLQYGIYLFHVPAFFIIVGLLWPTAKKPFKEFCAKRFARLMIPYLFWGVVSISMYCLMVDRSFKDFGIEVLSLLQGSSWPDARAFKSNSVLWFPPCMFSTLVLYWLLDKVLPWSRFKWAQVALVPLLYYIHQYCVLNYAQCAAAPCGLVLAIREVDFLVLGRLIGAANVSRWATGVSNWKLTVLGGVVFGCVFLLSRMVDYYHDAGFLFLSWGYFKMLFSYLAAMVVLMAICGFSLPWLAMLGGHSLGIMLFHKFIVVALQTKVMTASWWWTFACGVPTSFFVTVAAVGCGLLATILCKRYCSWLVGAHT